MSFNVVQPLIISPQTKSSGDKMNYDVEHILKLGPITIYN